MKPQRIRRWALTGGVIGAFVLAGLGAPTARAAEPIRIGFGMALTGGLSANGKPALLAVQIWKDDVNKRGGLLGRPVELVYYDDQTNPATVPGIYTKLLDVDKVDLIISGYGTNLIAPSCPSRWSASSPSWGCSGSPTTRSTDTRTSSRSSRQGPIHRPARPSASS